jgi:hypothetical protein
VEAPLIHEDRWTDRWIDKRTDITKIKIKLSRYRPGQTLGVPAG